MYMLNMVIILIVMYSNVVTAKDKIYTYLLHFNRWRWPSCWQTWPGSQRICILSACVCIPLLSHLPPLRSECLPTPRHSNLLTNLLTPRSSLFTCSLAHLCECIIDGKQFSKSQSGIVLILCPCDTGQYQTTFTNKVYKPKLDLFALSTPFVTGQ